MPISALVSISGLALPAWLRLSHSLARLTSARVASCCGRDIVSSRTTSRFRISGSRGRLTQKRRRALAHGQPPNDRVLGRQRNLARMDFPEWPSRQAGGDKAGVARPMSDTLAHVRASYDAVAERYAAAFAATFSQVGRPRSSDVESAYRGRSGIPSDRKCTPTRSGSVRRHAHA